MTRDGAVGQSRRLFAVEGGMDYPGNLILITGAAGWLGHRLLDILTDGSTDDDRLARPQRNLRLRGLLLPGETPPLLENHDATCSWLVGDLRDREVARRFCQDAAGALLVHAAGVIHPRRSRDFESINVGGTRNLLEEAASAGIQRVVVVSSNSPCGTNAEPDERFDESAPYRPYLGYGRSKEKVERLALEAHASGRIQTVIVRPPWFYGPRQPARQTTFFRMIRSGSVPVVGGGENRHSMAYIDNLVQGLLLAGTVPAAAGRVYWIADERPYSMNEIIDTVEQVLEHDFGLLCAKRRRRLPGLVSRIAYGVDATLQALGLYDQRIHVLSEMNKTIACDIQRAKSELQYRPTVALAEGMRRSIAWLRDRNVEI